MKKALLLGSFIALALLFGTSVFFENETKDYYQPREATAEKGIAGALNWLNMMKANQVTGELDYKDVLNAREQVKMADSKRAYKKSALNLQWEVLGPNNVGGRTRAFLIDNNDPNIFYAGGVSGGLFKSTNKGNSWVPVSDPGSNLAVTCIAQASDGTIYYGTGEGMYARNAEGSKLNGFIGGGVYKSTDGGESFELIPSTVPTANSTGGDWANVGKLAVDPNNDNRIYAATNNGLLLSEDAGETWTHAITSNPFVARSMARDMVVTPSGAVWVKIGSQIQYSPSGDPGTYVEITGHNPNQIPQNPARMRIAVSPQDENYVYVISTNSDNSFDKAYQSKDGGATWRVIGQGTATFNPHANQGDYNNAVRVSPHNKERIIVGGLDVYEWSESGGWQQLSFWAGNDIGGGFPYYVHADNHDVIFSPVDQNTFYIVNDGGVFRTKDDGVTFTGLNNNYVTTQFYHIGLGPEGRVMGGTQDNGTNLLDPLNNAVPGRSVEVRGGDGGYSQLSKLHPGVIFGETQNGAAFRSVDYGENWEMYIDQERMDPLNNFGTEGWAGWVMPYLLWEKLNDPHSTDSIRLGADTLVASLGYGGGATTFSGKFILPFDTTIIIPASVSINAGNRTISANSIGEFLNADGDSVGYVNLKTGDFEVSFGSAVFDDVDARAATRYNAGSEFAFESAINDLPVRYTLDRNLEPGDFVMVQDPVQAMFFMGPRSFHRNRNNRGGIWMTREILSDLSGVPEWWHIGDLANNETPICMAVSDEGDMLYVGTSAGRLYRFSNLIAARDSASADIDHRYDLGGNLTDSSTSIIEKKILRFQRNTGSITYNLSGRTITSIAVHPFDKEKVVVTAGNYGNSDYVFYADNASSADPLFKAIQGDLPEMPVYASTFNYSSNSTEILLGTEYGVYATSNADAANPQWVHEINDFANVPVYTLIQERTIRYDLKDSQYPHDPTDDLEDFEGTTYAGTYGRGIYKTNSTARYVGVDEAPVVEAAETQRFLDVYPNPAADIVNIDLSLESRADVEIAIHDMNGKMVKSVKYSKLAKETQRVEVRVNSLPKGAYVISMSHDGRSISGKFIKN